LAHESRLWVPIIVDVSRQGVAEYVPRFLECDAVIADIRASFVWVPVKVNMVLLFGRIGKRSISADYGRLEAA